MINETYIQQLANYIKKNLAKGYTIDSLKFALERQDYSRSAIEMAIELANAQLAEKAPILKEKPNINYELIKDTVKEEKDTEVPEKKSFFKRIFG